MVKFVCLIQNKFIIIGELVQKVNGFIVLDAIFVFKSMIRFKLLIS